MPRRRRQHDVATPVEDDEYDIAILVHELNCARVPPDTRVSVDDNLTIDDRRIVTGGRRGVGCLEYRQCAINPAEQGLAGIRQTGSASRDQRLLVDHVAEERLTDRVEVQVVVAEGRNDLNPLLVRKTLDAVHDHATENGIRDDRLNELCITGR